MIDDINTKRTELANQMAAAGAAALDFNATAAVLAAIPDTEPQQYVAAGTPENIAAILPATISPARRMRHGDRPTEALVFDEPAATSGAAPDDLQQLKALALAATPGPWEATRQTDDECCFAGYFIEAKGKTISDDGTVPDSNDAQFIAAANPAVVLDLIARIERATAHVRPVNTSSERVENAAGNEQVERAAAPAPDWFSYEESRDTLIIHGIKYSGELMRDFGNLMPQGQLFELVARQEDGALCVKRIEPVTASGDERADFEAWHRSKFATKHCTGQPTRDMHNGVYAEKYGPEDQQLMWEAFQARAALSAATKPTADLSNVPVVAYTKVVHQGWPEYNRTNEFSDGSSDGAALVKLADVQSLLATKPAAALADRILASVTKEMRAAGLAEANRRDCDADSSDVEMIFNAMLGAAPAASTIGAARTADQVRGQALEEAAELVSGCDKRATLRGIAAAIRALKRPTTTHNSEAGATQTTEGAE